MPRALDTSGLPDLLATALWPWIDAVEAVRPGMADPLRSTAGKAVRDLRHMIVVTAPVDTLLRDALSTSEALARSTAEELSVVATVRLDALLTLSDLIGWLSRARPSEWTRAAGVGW